jgi:hypothetical protein
MRLSLPESVDDQPLVWDALKRAVKDRAAVVREAALGKLGAQDHAPVELFLEALNDRDERVRGRAAYVLGERQDLRAKARLEALLRSSRTSTSSIVSALSILPKTMPALLAAALGTEVKKAKEAVLGLAARPRMFGFKHAVVMETKWALQVVADAGRATVAELAKYELATSDAREPRRRFRPPYLRVVEQNPQAPTQS